MYFILALKNLPQILMDYGFLILPICFFQLSRFKVILHYIYVIGISFSDLFYLYFIFYLRQTGIVATPCIAVYTAMWTLPVGSNRSTQRKSMTFSRAFTLFTRGYGFKVEESLTGIELMTL